MYSLKEGSKFEDFALMEALSEMTQTVSKSTGRNRVQWNFFVGKNNKLQYLERKLFQPYLAGFHPLSWLNWNL